MSSSTSAPEAAQLFTPERPKYDRALRAWFNSEASKIISSISVSNEDKALQRVKLLKQLDSMSAAAFKQYIEGDTALDDAKKQLKVFHDSLGGNVRDYQRLSKKTSYIFNPAICKK